MYDDNFTGKVSAETLQILFVRYGRESLDDEITAIFGEDEKNNDGSEKEITFGEYVKKVHERSMKEQKEKSKARKNGALDV